MRSLRLMVALVGTLLLAAACSAPVDSGPKTLRAASLPEDLRAETSSTTTTTAPTGESEEVTIYFIGSDQRLSPVKRLVSPPVTVEKVLQKLFAGPTTAEGVSGLRTAISPDTTVLGAPIEARIAIVNVSKSFAFGPVDDRIRAYAQVVFTAVDVGGVTGVLFSVNGHRQEVPAGDGSNQSAPLGRGSYPEYTPR
ncbi:MAG TPA: GerMN domain-containing protein [Acidimicrobiia bacterium]|nr:GerMN domain-containing protein [Acidimicrobiia bacterium]